MKKGDGALLTLIAVCIMDFIVFNLLDEKTVKLESSLEQISDKMGSIHLSSWLNPIPYREKDEIITLNNKMY